MLGQYVAVGLAMGGVTDGFDRAIAVAGPAPFRVRDVVLTC